MSWLKIIELAFSFINWFAKSLHDKQLLEAGEYKAIAEANTDVLEKIRKAEAARVAYYKWPTPEELANDPNNTD